MNRVREKPQEPPWIECLLSLEHFTYVTFSSQRPPHYDSHFAGGVPEAQRLYAFSKVMQPAVIALGPDSDFMLELHSVKVNVSSIFLGSLG